MTYNVKMMTVLLVSVILPQVLLAQDVSESVKGMHEFIEQIRLEMIGNSMLTKMIGVARGIAGFGAIWYIGYRVWRHLANAEPIDFYPLLRPFTIGLAIIFYPVCISTLDGILQPTVTGTEAMVKESDKSIEVLLKQKEEAVKSSDVWLMYEGPGGGGDREKWLKYTKGITDPGAETPDEGMFESVGNDIRFAMAKASYGFRNAVKEWMSQVLQVIFLAASLCINTLRTFNLVILALLGPLVMGLSVFDGLQQSLAAWITKYINMFLWLPVANLFGAVIGKIQEKMIAMDIAQINQTGDTFFSSSDAGYLIFMIIGIVGYFTVPSVANHIINAGGSGGLVQKVTTLLSRSATTVQTTTTGVAGGVANSAFKMAGFDINGSGSSGSSANSYMASKLSGNTKKK